MIKTIGTSLCNYGIFDGHGLGIKDRLRDVDDKLVEGEGDPAIAGGVSVADGVGEDDGEDVARSGGDHTVPLAPVEVVELGLNHLRGGNPVDHGKDCLEGRGGWRNVGDLEVEEAKPLNTGRTS